MQRLPFEINRADPLSLTEQAVRGLTSAIQSGMLKIGDRLPTILEMAAELGVSPMIIRNAVARLIRSGALCARRKSGIHVAAADSAARAHILYVTWSGAVSFYFAARDHAFLATLRNEGFHVTVVYVDGKEAAAGFPHLKRVLAVRPANLAVIGGGPFGVDAFLAEHRIRFVDAFPVERSPHALAVVDIDWTVPMRRLARHCSVCGHKRIVAWTKLHDQFLQEAFAKFGIFVQVKDIDAITVPDARCNAVEAVGFKAGSEMLRDSTELPDFIYSGDDFFSRGLITALLAHGVRIPDDVQFATQCNIGNIPVFSKPLTRIEMDPLRDAMAMAKLTIRAVTSQRTRYQNVIRIPKFVVGGTTRRRRREK